MGVQIVRYRGGSQCPRQRGIERTRSREQQRNTWISPPRKFHFYQKILELYHLVLSFTIAKLFIWMGFLTHWNEIVTRLKLKFNSIFPIDRRYIPSIKELQWSPWPWPCTAASAWNEGYPNVPEDFTITEKAPTRAFSWLKAPTSAFTFKTLFAIKTLC